MMKTRSLLRLFAIMCFVTVFLPLGCNRAVVARDTLAALDAASAGFQAWDKEHQQSIVDDNKGAPDVATQLISGYRKKRERIVLGFVLAYTAVGAATIKNPTDALAAIQAIGTAIQQLEGGGP